MSGEYAQRLALVCVWWWWWGREWLSCSLHVDMKCDLFVTVCEGVWKRLLCECEAIVWRVCVAEAHVCVGVASEARALDRSRPWWFCPAVCVC